MTDKDILRLWDAMEALRVRVERLTYAVVALAALSGAAGVNALKALIGN